MKTANYYLLVGIWYELQGVQITQGIRFEEYDPNDFCDVDWIVNSFIRNRYNAASPEMQERLRWAFEYYLITKNAPFVELRDDVQDLYLRDTEPGNPTGFLRLVGESLFGKDFLKDINPTEYVERNDRAEMTSVFA